MPSNTAQLSSSVTGTTLANHRLVILAETELSDAQAGSVQHLRHQRRSADCDATGRGPPRYARASPRRSGCPPTGRRPGSCRRPSTRQARAPACHRCRCRFAAPPRTTRWPAARRRWPRSAAARPAGSRWSSSPGGPRRGRSTWPGASPTCVRAIRSTRISIATVKPIYRTIDIFYQRIDLQRVNIPHADVHMRLFVRVIDALLADTMPLPRLWYFPGTNRTIVLPTSDSHTSTIEPHTAPAELGPELRRAGHRSIWPATAAIPSSHRRQLAQRRTRGGPAPVLRP